LLSCGYDNKTVRVRVRVRFMVRVKVRVRVKVKVSDVIGHRFEKVELFRF
jgi:hypothetical protein